MKKLIILSAVVSLGLFAGSCTSGAGNFQLYLTDAPVEGIEHVYITFSQIEVLKESEDVYTAILNEAKEIDLLELLNEEERIVSIDLELGTYTAIRLTISAAQVIVNGQTYTLTIDPPKVVTIPVTFTIDEEGTVKCVLDFDAAQSVTGDPGAYGLTPVIVVKSIGY